MKREIVCLPCGDKLRKVIRPSTPGEHDKFVRGAALRGFVCDNCNCEIRQGTECEALSIWSDSIPYPYSEWEERFINKT